MDFATRIPTIRLVRIAGKDPFSVDQGNGRDVIYEYCGFPETLFGTRLRRRAVGLRAFVAVWVFQRG